MIKHVDRIPWVQHPTVGMSSKFAHNLDLHFRNKYLSKINTN
jgi:hypothetical protein